MKKRHGMICPNKEFQDDGSFLGIGESNNDKIMVKYIKIKHSMAESLMFFVLLGH